MTASDDLKSLSLDDLVTLYRMQAEVCIRTWFPLEGHEPIFEAHEQIALEVERRGEEAQRRLLDLLDHPDEWVRYFAARDAYKLDPARCHKVLVSLVEEMAISSAWATETLYYFDPTFPEQLRAIYRSQKSSLAKRSQTTEQLMNRAKDVLEQSLSSKSKSRP